MYSQRMGNTSHVSLGKTPEAANHKKCTLKKGCLELAMAEMGSGEETNQEAAYWACRRL